MTDLIKRLKEAEEGSADLDREVERALGIIPMGVRNDGLWGRLQKPWTTSLDAALALAERLGWRVRAMDASINGRFSWCLESLYPRPGVDHETGATMIGTDFQYGFGATLATALCAAILKATHTGRE